MPRIAIVLPYYGALPWYFGYFLKSLEGIQMDVLFFSDLEVDGHPANFRQIRMSFEELNRLVCAKVPGAVPLTNTRKLCDYKPMYGQIFSGYLKDYGYWAFGDCDLVYGKALNKLLEEVVPANDVISLRKHWLSGSLTILKNTEYLNTLYMKAKSLDDVFTHDECVCFDELGGYWFHELEAGTMTMEDCEKHKDFFTATVWREPGIRFFHEDVMEEDYLSRKVMEVRDGCLYISGREAPAFHYINVKRNPAFRSNGRATYGDIGDYVITKAGMFSSPLGRKLWRLPWLCRAFVAHVRGYRQYARENGIGALVRHFWRRVGL